MEKQHCRKGQLVLVQIHVNMDRTWSESPPEASCSCFFLVSAGIAGNAEKNFLGIFLSSDMTVWNKWGGTATK